MNTLNPKDKVWVFQSDRAFSDKEEQEIKEMLADYLQTWQAHGTALKARAEVKYKHFITIGVDESGQEATGCSIDNMTRFIKNIESIYNLSLTNRLLSLVEQDNGLKLLDMQGLKAGVESGKLHAKTRVFNNMVKNIGDYRAHWETTLENSWHKRFLE